MARAKECFTLGETDNEHSKVRLSQLPDSSKLAQLWKCCQENKGKATVESWLEGIEVTPPNGGQPLSAYQVIDDLTFGEFRSWLSSSELDNAESVRKSLVKWVAGSTLRKSQSNEMFDQHLSDAVHFYEAILGQLDDNHPHRQKIREYLKENSLKYPWEDRRE